MSHDVFTPFLRRFTDEHARSLSELRRLYDRVRAQHQSSPWGRKGAIDRTSGAITAAVLEVTKAPSCDSLGDALDTCQRELLALEAPIFQAPQVDFSRPLSMREHIDLKRFLRTQEYFLAHEERISELLVIAVGNLSAAVMQSVPPFRESVFTVPLITLLGDPAEFVDGVIGIFAKEEHQEAGLFVPLMDQIYQNICRFSGVPADGSSKKALTLPMDSGLQPEDLVRTYFAGTPINDLLLTPFPFQLPDEQRFSGHWIIAPPGRGKTTLLHSMVMEDFSKDAAVILMDSKGDLIEPFRDLKQIEDRLIIVDPDPDHPIAINPLDIPKSDISLAVAHLEYVFSSLLESKMTPLQTVLFRSVLRALITSFPNPTLETFRDILTNGIDRYKEYIAQLPQDLQDFFAKEFNTKMYEDRRKEIIWRLRLLLENDTMRAMMLALRTRFSIGDAMDQGKVIIINNSKARLGDQGSEFFGRFFIAQVLAAAQQRSGRRSQDKKPVYFYIDECQNVIARDERIPTILDECRSQKVALILAHQRSEQITSPNVQSALSNCAIRYANSDDEAKFLSTKLRTTPAFLQSLKRGQFAVFVRDMTAGAIVIEVPRTDFSKHPKLTPQEAASLKQRMRERYGVSPPAPTTSSPNANSTVRFDPRPPAMEPWRLDGADAPKAHKPPKNPPDPPPNKKNGPDAETDSDGSPSW